MATNWVVEKRKITELKILKKNPRQLNKDMREHLETSLSKFGICDLPVINQDNTIIGGHQRLKVLKEMGVKEISVLVPEDKLTQDEVDELNIRLNKNTGDWDWDKLANEWDIADLVTWGFSLDELDIDIPDDEEEQSTGDEETPVPKKATTEPGDLYQLGNHRLLCGDSTNEAHVKRLLDGNEPILMVTDPPYGVNYDASWRTKQLQEKAERAEGKVKNDNRVDWSKAWDLFPGKVAYVWHASLKLEVAESLINSNYQLISMIIWVKQNFAISRGDYHWKHETCWYAVKNGEKHNWQGSRKETTVWEISSLNAFGKNNEKDEERTDHSTQKPIECMAKPIKNNTKEGQGVYDPFVGSGTTIIASEKNNRSCYAMELDPLYCDICVQRWVNYKIKQKEDIKILKNGEVIEWLKKNQD